MEGLPNTETPQLTDPQPIAKDRAQKLYTALTDGGVNLGVANFDEFLLGVQDSDRRKKLYESLSSNGVAGLGDTYADFEQALVVAGPMPLKKKDDTTSGEELLAASQKEAQEPLESLDSSGEDKSPVAGVGVELSENELSNLIDMDEESAILTLEEHFAGTSYNVEETGLGDALVIDDMLGNHESITIDLQPFTDKGKAQEMEKLRAVLANLSADKKSKLISPNKFPDYLDGVDTYVQGLQRRYPDFDFTLDSNSGQLVMSKDGESTTMYPEPGDRESYQKINKFIYDNLDAENGYDWSGYVDAMKNEVKEISISPKTIDDATYDTSYFKELIAFSEANGVPVDPLVKERLESGKKTVYDKQYSMSQKGEVPVKKQVAYSKEEINQYKNESFDPEIVAMFENKRKEEVTGGLVARQKEIKLETFLKNQPNREAYKDIVLQSMKEEVDKENDALIDGMTAMGQYNDVASAGYENVVKGLEGKLSAGAELVQLPSTKGTFLGLKSVAAVPTKEDLGLIQSANEVLMQVDKDFKELSTKVAGNMKKSLENIEDADAYTTTASRNYSTFDAMVNDFNKTTKNFLMDITSVGVAIQGGAKDLLIGEGAGYAEAATLNNISEDKRDLERAEKAFPTKLTYEEALELGREGEFVLREFGTQLPNIVAAVGAAGAGSSMQLGRMGTQALVGSMFGVSSAGAKYDELSGRQKIAEAAKLQLKELESMKGQMPKDAYGETKYDLERSIAANDIDTSDKVLAVTGAGIVEGTITGFLGTAPNALKVVKNLKAPDQIVKRMLQSNYKATASAVKEIGLATGREILEETSIEALTTLNDAAFLGDQIDFSMLDDVAITSIITSGGMNVPGTAYSTLITQTSINNFKSKIKQTNQTIASYKKMLVAEDLTDVQRMQIHGKINGLVQNIAEDMTKAEADAMLLSTEETKEMLTLSGLNDTLLKRAGVDATDNYDQANAKVKTYMKRLPKEEGLEFRGQLEAIQQRRTDILSSIDYSEATERVFGDVNAKASKSTSKDAQTRYYDNYKKFKEKIHGKAIAEYHESVRNSKEVITEKIKSGRWGMLTAENPNAVQATAEQNTQANERAIAWLEDKGYLPVSIKGKYGVDENSFFVEGLSSEHAIEFAKEFQQESVATDKGLVYQDGTMNPRTGEAFDVKQDDFFSVIETEEGPMKFAVDYDFEGDKTSAIGGLDQLRAHFGATTGTSLQDQADKAMASVGARIPNFSIDIVDDQEFANRTGTSEAGSMSHSAQGTSILINKDKATETTVPHEVFHAVLMAKSSDAVEMMDSAKEMLDAVRKVADPALVKRIDDFAVQYTDSLKSEEAMAELFGILASEYKSLPAKQQNIIKEWLQRIAKALGLRKLTDGEIIEFLNRVSKDVASGTETDIGATKVETKDVVTREQKIGSFDLEYFAETKEFNDLIDKGLVENNAKLEDLAGKQVAVHQPDNMFVGTVKKGSEEVFKGQGGVFYVTNTGNVWASAKQNSANALAKLINASVNQSQDGKGRMLLVRGTDAKMLSSTEGVKGGMLILEEMVDEGIIPRKDFRSSLIRVGKEYDIDFSGSSSATAIRKDIEEKFIKPDASTFEKRGTFLGDLIEDLSKTSDIDRVATQEFLGIEKNSRFTKAGVLNAIGNILTEKLLQGLPPSHMYAVVETNGEVEAFNDSATHPSYPWGIRTKDGSKPVLKLLSDREHAVKAGSLSLTDGAAPTQGKLGLTQRGMGSALVRQQKGGKPSVQQVKEHARENNVSPEATRKFLEELGYTPEQINEDGKGQAISDALAKFDVSRKRGNKYAQNKEAAIGDLQKSQYYQVADDTGRDAAMKELVYALDEKPKRPPSKEKITGKKPKKITVNEYSALKDQIRLEARAAREAKGDLNEKRKRLAEHVENLKRVGELTVNQAKVIINKLSSVNLDSETSVNRFIEYMDKVYRDAEIADRILRSNKKRKSALKNIKKKIGAAPALMAPLNKLFSIDSKLIPASVLDQYSRVLDEFSGRSAVLDLNEQSKVLSDIEQIFEAIDVEVNQIPQLALTYNSLRNEDLGFVDSVNDLVDRELITKEDGELMKKYKKDIVPKKESEKTVETPSEFEIKSNNVQEATERKAAQRFLDLVAQAKNSLSELSHADLVNLQAVIDNINAGYFSHYGQNLSNEIEAIIAKNEVRPKIKRNYSATIDRAIGAVKHLVQKGKMTVEYMIRQNPLYDVDTVLGNHNSKTIYNNTFGKVGKAYARMNVELDMVTEKLLRAEGLVAKQFNNNPNKIAESKYRQMLYLLQKEYEANPGSNKVFSAKEAAESVIKNYRSVERYNKAEADMLKAISEKYLQGENVLETLEKTFSKREREAISIVEKVNEGLQDKFIHTAAVIRGAMPSMINSYVHHSVASKSVDAMDTVTRKYNSFKSFSTKAGTVVERTGGVKPLNLDPITSTMSGARETLTDYYMTSPIKTVYKTLNKLKAEVDSNPDSTEHQKDIVESLMKTFEDATRITFTNDFNSDDVVMFNQLRALGYKALLGSVPRAFAELSSNMGYIAVGNGAEFFGRGVRRYGKLAVAHDSREILKNVGSEQSGKLYGRKVSGKSVDVGLFPSEGNFKGVTARGVIGNKMEQIRRYASKATYTPINMAADALISTPDKAISRPLWFGAFSMAFKKEAGKEPNFDKIKANDAEYMRENKEAIDKATKYADIEVTRAATSVNPYNSILKNKVEPGKTANRMIREANGFMTNFIIYEYTTARAAMYALLNDGEISKQKAGMLLGATAIRMSSYYVMYQMFVSLFDAAASSLFGLDLEEEEFDFGEMFMRQLAGSGLSLFLGRNLGNFAKVPIALGTEVINDEYFGFLRGGDEYDPYKHGLFYSPVNREQIKKGQLPETMVYLLTGPYSPLMKTLFYTGEQGRKMAVSKKDSTKERAYNDMLRRTTLEILGNLGMVPLYKDVRRIVLKDMYQGRFAPAKSKKKAQDIGDGSGFNSDFDSGF